MVNLFAIARIAVLLALPAVNDPDTASLGGRVTDENNVALPSATISARNVFTREFDSTRSDETGSYAISNLRQGKYTVFGKAEGYGCTWIFNVFLYNGQRTQLDVKLSSSARKARAIDCTKVQRTEQ